MSDRASAQQAPWRTAAAALLVIGLWGLSAPYVDHALGFDIATSESVEVVDHVLPGVPVLAIAAWWLVTGWIALAPILVVLMGGLWMTTTHIPLLLQAARGEVGVGTSLFHSLPGIVILVGAAVVVALLWRAPAEAGPPPDQGQSSEPS